VTTTVKHLRCILLFLAGCSLAFLGGALSGCGTRPGDNEPALMQRILDEILPREFTGSLAAKHKNPWMQVRIKATGLRHNGERWLWETFEWERNGPPTTSGEFTAGPNDKPLP